MQGARALAAERRRVEGERMIRRGLRGEPGDGEAAVEEGVVPVSVMRGQATGARRAAARRQRAAKAALMAQPRTNTYLQRKQRAKASRLMPEPEPEPQTLPPPPPPPQDSVSLWRAQVNSSMGVVPGHADHSEARVQLDHYLLDDSHADVGGTTVTDPVGSALLEPVEQSAKHESPAAASEGEAPAQNTGGDNRDALDSPVVPVEHSSTDIAVAELRRQQAAFHGASIGASDTLVTGDEDNELSYVDLDLASATTQSQRGGGLSSTQGLHTSQAVEELRRARDPALAGSVVMNDDASPWRVLQPGARQTAIVQTATEATMLPNDLREMVSVLAAEEVHRCVSVEAETVKAALQEDLKKAEGELSAQRERESQMKQSAVEAANNAVADERLRHAEAIRALIAEHTAQAALLRREREEAQSRSSGLEAQLADTQGGLVAARAETQALTKSLSDATEQAAAAASAAGAEVGSLQRKLFQSESALATLKHEKGELEASLATERTAHHETKTDATKRLALMDEQLQSLRQELLRQQKLTQASDESKAAAEREIAQRVSEKAVDEAARAELQAKVNALQQEVGDCKRQIQTLTAQLEAEREAGRARKSVAKAQQTAPARDTRVETSDAEGVACSTRTSDWLHAAQRSASQLAQDLAADDDQGHSQRSLLAATMLLKNAPKSTPLAVRMRDGSRNSAADRDEIAKNEEAKLSQDSPNVLQVNRRRRLSQMRRHVSVDSGVAHMSDEMCSSTSSVSSRLASPVLSPSAIRARQRAETHSLQEVLALRKRNAELELELRLAKQSLNEHSCSNVEDAVGVTAAMDKIRAEVTATVDQQDRVMDKLRWIKQTLQHADLDSAEGGASVLPRAHGATEDTDAQGAHSVEPLTIDLASDPDGPMRGLEDTEFSPRTEQAIVESLQSSIGVTAPQ